eukprot:m.75315 g.75315  ORF g.75315 m.75315 type:complete len:453 (+) comp14398_c0_seq2:215-1573(+)
MATGSSTYTDKHGQQNVFDLASESFLPWNVPTANVEPSINDILGSAFLSMPSSSGVTTIPKIEITPPWASSTAKTSRAVSNHLTATSDEPPSKRAKANGDKVSHHDHRYQSPSPQHHGSSPPAEISALTTPFTRKLPDEHVRLHATSLAETQPGTRHASSARTTASDMHACYFPMLDRLPSTSQADLLHYGGIRPSHDPFLATITATKENAEKHQQLWVLQLQQAAVQLQQHASHARHHLLEMGQARARLEDARATLEALKSSDPELKSVLDTLTVTSLVEPDLHQLLAGGFSDTPATTTAPSTGMDGLGDLGQLFSGSLEDGPAAEAAANGFTSTTSDGNLLDPSDLSHTLDMLVACTHASVVKSATSPPTATTKVMSSLAVPSRRKDDSVPGSPSTRSRGELTPSTMELEETSDAGRASKQVGLSSLAVPVSQVPRHMLFQMERFGEKSK